MNLTEFETQAVLDRLEGWEIVEFLQVPTVDILAAAMDNDWITEDNLYDFLEFTGLKR